MLSYWLFDVVTVVVSNVKDSITGVNGFEVERGYKSHVMKTVRNNIIIIVKMCFERNCFIVSLVSPYDFIIELYYKCYTIAIIIHCEKICK